MPILSMRSEPRANRRVLSLLLCASLSPFALPVMATAQDNSVMDEIIVTGSPLSNSVDEAITGVSVLSGDELSDRLAGTIGETLKTEPGVSSTFFGAGASRPLIRGQGGDRVRVLTNGIGSIDASSASPDHAVAVEPAQAERIEVLRGAALLRYGSSGSGGVINVIDGRIPTKIPEDGPSGAVRIGVSTVDKGRDFAASLDGQINDHFVAHVDATWHETKDFEIPGHAEHEVDPDDDHEEEGIVENSWAEASSATAGLSYIGDRGHIGFAVHRFDSKYGVPGGHGHEDNHGAAAPAPAPVPAVEEEEELVSINLDQTRIDVNAVREFDGFIERAQFFGGYADYKHTEFEGDDVGTVFTNEGWEARLELIQKERSGWTAAYGAQLRDREFAAVGDEAFVPPTNTSQLGIYTYHKKEMGDLHLEASGRYEHTAQENNLSGQDIDFNTISISGGGDVHLSDTVRMGGTAFRTQRAPTTEELFSDGPHLATSQFEKGDVTLGKETATGVEFAMRHRKDGHFASLNVFYTDYSDYIYEVETGAIQDDLEVFQFTAEDATFKGFEVQAGSDLGTWNTVEFSVDALAEYVEAKTDSGNLPRIPPLSALAGIEAVKGNVSLRTELDYTSKQTNVGEHEEETDGYSLVNVFLGWRPEKSDGNVKISLSVMNLLNQEARQHTSFLKESVPLPGRNLRASINTKF